MSKFTRREFQLADINRTADPLSPEETNAATDTGTLDPGYARNLIRNWAKSLPAISVIATALLVGAIEFGRLTGQLIPIPFLLVYASVVFAGGAGGKIAGAISGVIAATFVVHAANVGFGPKTLTGGEVQVLLGALLYIGTGLLLGRVRDQRNRFLANVRRHEIELESIIIERTENLRKNEEALKSSEEKFRQMAENISEVFWLTDPAKNEMIYISPAYEKIWQRSCESLYDSPLSFVEAIHPNDRERVVMAFKKQTQGDYDEEYRIVRPDGSIRHIRDRAFPVKNKEGAVYRIVGIAEDVTEERRRDEQLHHAQKMEVVGQLTGGVAHDFNNLLAVIRGNAELLVDQIGENNLLASIDRAASQGAELTQRLLAFSRRQKLEPQAIDLARLVSETEDLLQRTIGEPIAVDIDLPDDLWPVRADPSQLESALMNLAINARDAMPRGGTLSIGCENTRISESDQRLTDDMRAGDYVQITVGDTGIGMAEEVLKHAFEPFYTTKGVGEGSGLGLSMVYGFVQQSGGDVIIKSEPNVGTQVKLLLPRATASELAEKPAVEAERASGQGECILVLEDDPDVRFVAVTALERLGYRVKEAADASAARQVLDGSDPVDLLLTDVVLPGGVSGPELAADAKAVNPNLKVVFMTGNTAELYADDKIPGLDGQLLSKPFRRAELATAIQESLAA